MLQYKNLEYMVHAILFGMFLFIYTMSLVGNLSMISLIRIETRLHTPIYFFLSNLSFGDITYSSVIAPKALVNFLAERKVICFAECVTQFFFQAFCVNSEALLLAVMAYYRFIAICKSLMYTRIMSRKVCVQLVAASYIYDSINAIVRAGSLFSLSFCGPNIIDHFFCDDLPPIQKLFCSDTHMGDTMHFLLAVIVALSTILVILVSYVSSMVAILRIQSNQGSRKAFSTYASHLMAYGTLFFMYLRPTSSNSSEYDKVVAIFYSFVIPMLNPLIYSLRNKEVKDALRKTIYQKIIPH
uniref:G-protein coupled receptors family 1 profile domain-containing protein n=1 Tax=Gopherus agassizii TaxID=38772 RepID=A0A452J2L9_9SAUR